MKTGLANYFYFLKDDAESLSAFRDHMLEAMGATPAGVPDLGLSGEGGNSALIATRQFEDVKLDVYLSLLSDVSVLVMLWDGTIGSRIDQVDGLSSISEYLGEATVFVGACPTRQLKGALPVAAEGESVVARRERYLCKECGLRGESLMLKGTHGSLCHVPPTHEDKSQHYMFTPAPGTNDAMMRQLMTHRIPALDMTVRRLRKKEALFRDRRTAIQSEHRAMDGSVGRFFHREVTAQDADEKTRGQRLAAEIGRLSQIYAVLATDAQLIKEAEASLKEELDAMHRSAASIAGHAGSIESTLVMYYDGQFGSEVKALTAESGGLALSLERVEAAVDIVRTEVELLRGSETMELQTQTKELLKANVSLQQERMALLVAANVIEFVIIFYYTLSSWDAIVGLATVEKIPALVRFGSVAALSGAAVTLTHMIAGSVRQRKRSTVSLVAAGAMVLVVLAMMLGATLYWT